MTWGEKRHTPTALEVVLALLGLTAIMAAPYWIEKLIQVCGG